MEKYLLFSDGTSTHTYKWAKELNKIFDLYILSLTPINENLSKLFAKDKIYSLNQKINSNGGNYKQLLKIFKINKIIKQISPDIINAHYITSYGFIASIIKCFFYKNTKLVLSAWGTDILVTPKKNKILKIITRFSLGQADLVSSDSYSMTDEIMQIRKNTNVITFPWGVKEMPQNLENEKNEYLIFSNRALSSNYNIDSIIKWFSKLVKENNKYKLIIANNGDKKQNLIELVKKLGLSKYIKFIGFISQLEQENYYKKSKFFISIPSSDSTALSLLEAMSFGCIPIVSNLPANREWVINKINGFFFKQNLTENDLLDISNDYFSLNKKIIRDNAVWEQNISYFCHFLKRITKTK